MIIKNRKFKFLPLLLALVAVVSFVGTAAAQTTTFTYQGKLTDAGNAANGSYQMEFKLFGSTSGTDQFGGAITNPNVTVSQGIFTVNLDFGQSVFSGADRFLQISVRRSAAESFVTLNPRQQITSSPYSIRTLSAQQADVALDSNKLGGVDASQYVTTTSVGNSFIKNATTQQTGNFNISGNGVIGGNIGIGTNPDSGFKFDVNGAAQIRPNGGSTEVIRFGYPSFEPGITLQSGAARADIRFSPLGLKLLAGSGTGTPPSTNGIAINTAGNVGIGTSSPSAKLTVAGAGAFSASGAARFDLLNTTAGTGFLQNVTDGGLFQIVTTNGATRLVINSDGNVGIGTNTPTAGKLVVNGASGNSGYLGGTAGVGGVGTGPASTALEINNGAIKVTGAGIGTSTAVFIYVKTDANTCGGIGGTATAIDNPYTNDDPNAILFVTLGDKIYSNPKAPFIKYETAASAPLSCPQLRERWVIYTDSSSQTPVGAKFNIMVVKP